MFIAFLIGVAIFIGTSLSSIPFASLFEWILHRYLMHKKFIIRIWKWKLLEFDYAFNAHAKVHHHVFQADETYHVQDKKDKKLIPMAWWNGIVLIAIGSIPFIIVCCFVGHWFPIILGGIVGCGAYYGAYERIHWCMHLPLPKRRIIERNWFFYRLNGHHLLHHRYMHKNFNVVLPLWDLLLGTLLLRSKIKFKQAMGVSVPNVQPL